MSKELRFSPYQESWETEFNRIRDFLSHILTGYYKEIHHIGSTSVKHLGAKPIIDINIEYQENDITHIISILEENGYRYEGCLGIEGRHVFKRDDHLFHEQHLYATQENHKELLKHLSFRNTVRQYPIYRKMYEDVKKKLIEKNNKDRNAYTDNKTEVITYIMKESVRMKSIVVAGGCFWGVEAYFKMIEGVVDTEVGYINGDGSTSYKEVCAGSGHAEAVYIQYDEDNVSLKKILDHLFNIIDPTSINKQGPDIGVQYRTGIYNYQEEDLPFINNYIQVRQKEYKRPIVLEVASNLEFYRAEDVHQDYLTKNKHGYCHVNLDSHKNVL